MKKYLILFLYLLVSGGIYAQNKGINYQAVILDPNPIELPGNNVSGQPLSNGKVCLRFAIVSPEGSSEYVETHSTQTDEYGLVNLVIGNGVSTSNDVVTLGKAVYSDFNSIKWDANVKSLKVYVSFDACASFKEIANQPFNYTPYSLYAGAVDYKNVDGAPTNLSQFTNDVGYLVPKDLDPIKKDILNTQNSVTNLSDKTDGKFLLVNQHLSTLDSTNRVTEKKFDTYLGILSNHDGRINANSSNIAQTNATLNNQVSGLQNQINATNFTINQLGGTYEVIGNKSDDARLGASAPSSELYTTQKAVKTYVDVTIQDALAAGAPDASTLAKGKVKLAGDLGGTADLPTVPALALKESLSNKSTNVVTDGGSDSKYPSVKAIKDYVDGQVTGSSIAAGTSSQYYRGDKTWQTLDKTAVGLTNVDNTSDANKPISTATQTALDLKLAKADTTSLSNRINQRELSSNKSNNIVTDGESESKYPSVKAIKQYVDAQITGGSIVEGQTTQYYRGDKTWQTLDKAAVGLTNVDNTSDLNKPVSTATQTALDLKLAKADTLSLSNRIDIRELLANKSNDTMLGTSTTLYPTQKAVKNYVDNKITNGLTVGTILGTSVANGATLSNGTLKLAPANASNPGIVTTGTQYFAGYKSFIENITIKSLEIGRSTTNGLTNIVFGEGVLRNNFIGEKNIGIGDAALNANGQGSNNIAIGHSAMYQNTAGNSNVAIGNAALFASDHGLQNVAIGQDALKSATSSDNSVAIGAKALSGLTSGLNNTIIGSLSFKSLDAGNNNTALGFDNFSAMTSGSNNIVLGRGNGPNFTQGNGNLVIGNSVDLQNGDGQILIGNGLGDIRAKHNASYWDFGTIGAGKWQGDIVGVEYGGTGSNQLTGYVKGNGTQAMTASASIPVADIEGAEKIANKTASIVTDGTSDEKYPTAKAVKNYVDTKTGSSVRVVSIIPDGLTNGVAISNDTLKIGHATTLYPGLMTTEGQAFAGYKSFLEEIGVKGLVLGRGRGNGIGNIALGANNLINTTFGSYNIGIGLNALNKNTEGSANIAIGQYAFYANTTGSQNVVIGNSAFSYGYSAFGNVVLGSNTFSYARNSLFSVVIGANTLQNYTQGSDNTVIGSASLNNLSEGNSNTILGYGNLPSAQSSYANVVVGSNNGLNFVRGDNNVILGNSIEVSDGTSGNVFIGDGLGNIRANHDGTSWKLGLIGSGTWQGDSITIAHGGTGATTKEGAFDALSPMSAAGDLIYGGTNGTGTRLAAGSDGQVLTLSNGVPGWSTPSSEKVTTSPNLSSADNGSTLFTNTNVNLPNDVLPDGFRVNIVNTSSINIYVNSSSTNNLNYQQNSSAVENQGSAILKPYSKMEVYYFGGKFILVGDFNLLN